MIPSRGELSDIIMNLLQAADPLGALFLAMTCRHEYARYHRLGIFNEQRAALRDGLIQLAAQEGTLVWSEYIPSDRNYAYWKRQDEESFRLYAARTTSSVTSERASMLFNENRRSAGSKHGSAETMKAIDRGVRGARH